ncbi:unnamed protein product [Macrosiphum euphorbiae]|uniref:Uncharacterized protein n=1 Tax=Macrosiphum euphorbiae TaxID=13131 RepID=A0AAV0XHS1_9HEMI|nr:unnamed protein product [Macrosiphum euphorbiae]
MDTDELSIVEDEYDDGVVCFGPVTESQLNRFKRLPRRTVLPSDFVLSQSLFEQNEDKKNDQSTVLDENTSTCVDNSINITHSTKNVDQEKKEIEATELKQSFSEDSNSKFSSPCFSKCIPNAKLMDTEVINRYIRMGSTSSNDSSLSEDQNKSTFEDETVSFTEAQEMESIQDNCVFDETSTCEHFSVSSAIEQSLSINQPNVLDDSNNVCTLIHCSQKDDTDLSICSDSELGDVTEDSIVADEYSVTPGKQRLFDLRVTKQSLRAKALVASAPFMDRIEETTTPVVPKVLNSPLILNNISCRHSEINENSNVLSITEIPHGTSIEHFNQTSNENVFETSKFIDATAGELLISSDLKSDIVSVNKSADTMFDETMNTNKHSTDGNGMNVNMSLIKTDQIENTLNDMVRTSDNEPPMNIMSSITIPTDLNVHYDNEYLIAAQPNAIATDTSVDDKIFDETMKTNKLSINNQSTDSNKSLNETEHKFDGEKPLNIMSNIANSISGVDEYNNEKNPITTEVDIISISTSVVDKTFDETVYTNKLSTNNQSMDMNNSLNETNIENTSNVTEHQFDSEKSMNIRANMALPTSDVNDEEFSVAMEVDIKSTNTSCVDKELNKSVCTNGHSINNESTDSNKSLNETNFENTFNVTEHKFDGEKSINIMSNKANPLSSADEYNDGENSIASDVDIISISTSKVDKIFDETVCTNKLSTNNQSMDMNNSLNETNIENTSNVTEHQFDSEKSMNIRANMALPTSDVNDEEFSVAMEVDIKSTNTSCVDKELNKTVFTNGHSINNQSTDSNKSLNETNFENTLNVTEHKFDGEKSINIKANPLSSADEYNDGENSIASDVDIISISTSEVDKIFVETVCTNILSTNNQSMDVNKSLNETNIENTLNVTEHKFDGEKSTNIMSNIAIPLPGVNDCIDKENSIASKVDIKSINTSIVDKIFDESMLINANKLLTDSRIMNCNKSHETESTLNNTEHRVVNNNQNASVSAVHFDEKLHLSKLDKSILKSTINSDSSFVEINKVNITCNTSLEDPSCMMRQYLDFELAVNEMCNDISSASGPVEKSNKPKESYDNETLENLIEQTLSSDTFNLTKVNENVSNYDGSNLSVIIENKSLETSCNNIEPNEDFVSPNNDVPITLDSESIVKEVNDIELLNKSTVLNTVATPSKSEVGLAYGTDVNIQIKAKESISINCTITDSGLVENINETKHNESSMFSDELSKLELDTFTKINKNLNNITTKQIFISEDVNEIHSTQNTLDENNLHLIADQINITDIPNSTAFELIPETEITKKNLIDQDEVLNNDNQQQDLLDATKCIDNSLEEFTNLEQMFNFGDNAKGKQVEYKTPKTQKLLDFSIIQQTPTFDNPAKKQKLLNFSIVDQTPILQSTQQKYPIENVINDESLINFSSVDQMWNSEVVTKDEINFKDLQNSSNYSSSNNLSTISAPDLELLADESIKRNTSNFSNSSFDQTITDSNLNLSTHSCAINKTQNGIIELNNLEPLLVINRQIVAEEPSDSLNQTIKQNESRQKTFYDKHCVAEASTKVVKPDLKLLSKSTSNKNIDSAEFKDYSNQEPCFNPNERAIVDFSIIDQGMLENVGLKNNTDITSFESDRNVSNLIEVSFVTKSEKQTIISSENPIIPITSHSRAEKSIQSNSDEMNSTALHLEESTFLHNNTELLTDIQMNDESLFIESPEKSSIIDSFHSIELDHVQEDNKRKMETTQEYDNNEKKMKVETELNTPMSMLYKIKNMFRSSERQPSCVNNAKENSLISNKCYQKLNFNKFEENNEDFTKRKTLKKPEVIVKSKIPCKVTDRSLTKNDEFNSSSLSSLNDSIKQKKTIPKFSGVPVLSDVSNSSNRKCAESRIPSKFQK